MNNDFVSMVSSMMNMGNPQSILNNQINSNPQLGQMANQIRTMMSGSKLSKKDFTIQWCKQNGIPEEQVMEVARMMGLK